MRAALYARVSTNDKDQDHEVQLLQLRRYVEAHDWEIYDVYKDTCSGKAPRRPGLNRLLRDAEARKFDVVLVLRIDRIMRSVRHFYNLADTLDFHRVKIVSVADGMDYSTPIGKLVRGILLQVAEFEVEQLSARTKEGLEKARAEGKTIGRPAVEIDLDRFLALMQQPGMSKAKACKMLGYSKATVNNRLRDAGLDHLVRKPTRGAATKGNGQNDPPFINKPAPEGIDSKRTIVSDSNEAEEVVCSE
jgi:DNA invertase Pin-like site-specific DNA recombinase